MPAKWQTIRVFISSTFRDMHAERDHLVKVAFPVLRERLEKYRVHLVDIDLRWGITEQQSDNDEVLDLCLDQIDDCRPFFVGLLGERYGWLPNALPAPQSKHGWTQLHTGKSVTELEILRGVLLNENMREHGLFFFRDRAFSDDVPQAKRAEVQAQSPEAADKLKQLKQRIRDAGLPIPIVENYPCRYAGLRINWRLANIDIDQADRHALEKVAADGLVDNTEYAELDERLKTIVHKYSVVYLTELEEFGHLVLDRLWDAIRDELKHKETTSDEAQFDPLEVELGYHERFMESRLRVYVGRELLQRELVKFADRDGKKPALVAGPSGSGKSAALAKFVDTYSNAHPETLVIPHFIGASAASTGLRQTLHRFCSVLKTEFGFACGIPPDIDSLITTFRLFLGQVPAERRVVLVIDGLNQLDEGDNAQQLHWLPRQLPPHVKLVTSCIRGSTRGELVLKAFRHRPHHRIDIPPLTHSEQREIVTEVPSLSAKTLDDQQIGLLLSNPATENPLYLLVALEELRGFGSYEQLRHRMARMPRLPEHQPQWESWLTQARAAAQSIDDEQRKGDELQTLGQIETTFRQTEPVEDPLTEIFLQVIERLEDEFDPKIVRAVLSLLASARRGLSDRELLDLVEHKGVAVDDSTSDLFPILRQLRFYLQHRGELRDFFHRNLYKAAKKHLLSDDAVRRANHERLAAYFFGLLNPSDAEPWSGDSPRALSELPHHQIEGALWSDLASTLCDLRFVAANCTAGMIFDLVNVYSVALNSLPELRKEREKKLQHQRRLRQYGADLTTCAREFRVSGQRARGRTTFGLRALVRRLASRARTTRDVITLPTPPDSRQTHESMRQTEAASAATNSAHFDITRVSRIQSFAAFVSTHIPQLNRFPNHTIAIGFNHASAGPVADQAGHLLESSRTAFLRRDFRPSAPPLTHLCVRTLEGHRGSSPVRAVAITPDGDTAVSVSGTTLAVWDVASGKLLRTLEATKSIDAVALTPDGTTAVSAGRDRALRVWEVASGELLKTLGRDINSVTALAITADGGKAALANYDRTFHLWDLATGELLWTFGRHGSKVSAVAFTPDGATVVSACSDGTFRAWNVKNGELLKAAGERADQVSLTPDGKLGISNRHGTLRVLDLTTGELLRTFKHIAPSPFETVTPDGNTAVSTDGGVWDLANGKLLRRIGVISAIALTADGATAVAVLGTGRNATLSVLDIATGELPRQTDRTTALVCTPTGNTASWKSGDSRNIVWRVETSANADLRDISASGGNLDGWSVACGELMRAIEGYWEFVLTPDGRAVVSTASRKTVHVWDVATGKLVSTLEGQTGRIHAVAFTPEGSRAVFASNHKTIRVWNIATGELLLKRQTAGGTAVAITPDGNKVVAASRDVHVWDVASGELLRTLEGYTMIVLTPDGTTAISASAHSNSLHVWDVASGKVLRMFERHKYGIQTVAISPDGKTVVSASERSIRVWSVTSGAQLNMLEGHVDTISAVAFLPDGNRVASASLDGTIRVWNLARGKMVALYPANPAYSTVATASNNRLVATDGRHPHFLTLCNWP